MSSDLSSDLVQLGAAMNRFRTDELFRLPYIENEDKLDEGPAQEVDEERLEFERANSLNWDNPEVEDILPYSEPWIVMSTDTFVYLLPRYLSGVYKFLPLDDRVGDTYTYIGYRLEEAPVARFIKERLTADEKALLLGILTRFDNLVFKGRTSVATKLSFALSSCD